MNFPSELTWPPGFSGHHPSEGSLRSDTSCPVIDDFHKIGVKSKGVLKLLTLGNMQVVAVAIDDPNKTT